MDYCHQSKIRIQKEIIEKNDLPFSKDMVILKNSTIKEIDYTTAKKIILEYEWLKSMPRFIKYIFGIYFNINGIEYLGGVVIYSIEYSANKQNIWKKYDFNDKLILLSRGTCLWWTPKNTASYFISKTTDWLKKNTNYKIITATVDPSAGEIGTIYQSLNWNYIGLMQGNYNQKNGKELHRFSVYINGKIKGSRSIRNEFGTIKKEAILNKYPNAIFVPQYRKRRYFYFIGNKYENKNFLRNIKNLILPYPKRDISFAGLIYLITNKINNKKYVGQTTRSLLDRINDYKSSIGCNPYLLSSFRKYGFDNFEFTIIDTATNLVELNEKEIYWISKHNTQNKDIGYNIESGGLNSLPTIETRQKLSIAKKNIKQSKDWINKRNLSMNKRVIKFNKSTNIIIEDYVSLAVAGIHNLDKLSYTQINRKCLGISKQNDNIIWCYHDDYINNTIPTYTQKKYRSFKTISSEDLEKIYNDFTIKNISIRKLSKINNINYSDLLNFINKKNENNEFKNQLNLMTIAICKKTNIKINDPFNKSGAITTHISKYLPDVKIPTSNYHKNKIKLITGKFWYEDYFTFK